MENVGLPAALRPPAYDYAVAGRALAGERQSGDASLVEAVRDGVLVAVVDGLGHGDEAAAASAAAMGILRAHAGEPVHALLQRCHDALQPTRGAAVVLVALDVLENTLTWAGVGNVEAVVITARQGMPRDNLYLANRGGVVGYRMPAVQAKVASIFPGDLLIIATDGIDSRFVSEEIPQGAPKELARAILERCGKASDDALVLVLRWFGRTGAATRKPS